MLDFLAYLELERGVSRNTLESYRSDLLQFGAFLARARSWRPRTPARADVADFLTGLAPATGGRAAATATIQRKAACLRSFYRHLRREGMRESDPTAEALARRARARSCRTCSGAPRCSGCSSSRRAPTRSRCATARCSS